MKKYLLCILLLPSLYLNAQTPAQGKKAVVADSFLLRMEARNKYLAGKPFPEFNATYKNEPFTNKDIAGKTVFVNFWFETCAPCMAEMGALNELYDSLKNNTNFEFVSFTFESPEKIEELTKKLKIRYKVISVPRQTCYKLNQNNGFPTSIIVDKNGVMKFINSGGTEDKKEARAFVFAIYKPKILSEL